MSDNDNLKKLIKEVHSGAATDQQIKELRQKISGETWMEFYQRETGDYSIPQPSDIDRLVALGILKRASDTDK